MRSFFITYAAPFAVPRAELAGRTAERFEAKQDFAQNEYAQRLPESDGIDLQNRGENCVPEPHHYEREYG
ncbi:MAG: hypothetical protein ABJG78_17710 [Cyclobacteriaceae bacterium]